MVKKPEPSKRFYKAVNFHPDDHARLQALAEYLTKKESRPPRKPVSLAEAAMYGVDMVRQEEGADV